MWAVARYDFGLTHEEFGRLSLAQFAALWDRRSCDWKRSCYLQGIIASCIYNVHRTKDSDHIFSAQDFVPRPATESERDEIVWQLKKLPFQTMPEQERQQAKATWKEKLLALGRKDVDVILDSVFD